MNGGKHASVLFSAEDRLKFMTTETARFGPGCVRLDTLKSDSQHVTQRHS